MTSVQERSDGASLVWQLRGIDVATGMTRWDTPLARRPAGEVNGAILDDLVVLRVGADVVAVETSNGATRWTWDHPRVASDDRSYLTYLEQPVPSGPTIGLQLLEPDGEDFPTTSTVFVDRATGLERWRTASGALSSFAFDGATLYEYGEGELLRARDPLTGALRLEVAGSRGRLLATPESLFVADDAVSAVDPATGTIRWSDTVFYGSNATALGVTNNLVIVGSRKFERAGSSAQPAGWRSLPRSHTRNATNVAA